MGTQRVQIERLAGLLGLLRRYKRFLSYLSWSSRPTTTFVSSPLIFQFICPHLPASWAGSRAGPLFSQLVCVSVLNHCQIVIYTNKPMLPPTRISASSAYTHAVPDNDNLGKIQPAQQVQVQCLCTVTFTFDRYVISYFYHIHFLLSVGSLAKSILGSLLRVFTEKETQAPPPSPCPFGFKRKISAAFCFSFEKYMKFIKKQRKIKYRHGYIIAAGISSALCC